IIVSTGLKCQAPDGNFLFAKNPERFANTFEKAILWRRINSSHFLEKREGNAQLLTNRDNGGDVFGKAGPAITNSGVEKTAADTPIHSNAVGDFFHVSAAGIANR